MRSSCTWKYCLLCTILLVYNCGFLTAQTKVYTLTELTEKAKNYLPSLQQKMALINSARAELSETKHSFLPQVNISDQVNLGTDNSLAGSYLPITVIPSTSSGVTGNNNSIAATGNMAVLYGQYELMNFGLNTAKLNYAQSFVNLRQADLQKDAYYLELEVARLYFSLLKTQYRLETDRQNVNRYDSIFSVIHALTLSGLVAGSDSSLAKAELSRARIVYNQTVGIVNQVKEQLAYLTGIPAALIRINTQADRFLKDRPTAINYEYPDTINNPLLFYYNRKLEVLRSNDKLISKSYLPKILLAGATWARGSSIQYNNDYTSLANGLGYQRYNYEAGIAITYNLFNGMFKRDKLAINRFQLQASDFELQQQKSALQSALLQAENALKITEANLLEMPVQLQAAEDTYRQKLAQYKAGIISLIDLTNASFVLYRSQTDYIETISDWYVSELNKSAAAGTLDTFIQTIK